MIQSAVKMRAKRTCVTLLYTCVALYSVQGAEKCDKRSPAVWYKQKDVHVGIGLSDSELRTIAQNNDNGHLQSVLDPILVTRIPGTEGHTGVRKHIVSSMKSLGWTVEEDSFQDSTPHGQKPFTNIIATLDPNAPRRIVLACHYDSKFWNKKNEIFIGATDSAVPCAMMINIAKTLHGSLKKHKLQQNDVTLQLLFLDGEEAFVQWSSTDSTYGARNLASKLHNTPYPQANQEKTNELHRMDMFVLLDLIGTEDCQFYSLFKSTDKWYKRLVSFETRLNSLGVLNRLSRPLFKNSQLFNSGIEDDHIPFMNKGVDILHLISVPFPSVWHKISDNGDALHYPTIQNINIIMRAFVADYLHLAV
ncbi:unnamed protein product [Meganyctiphanes norvegica]|uniref:Glutaminyl-peptide cyclotransferase n=1 Tax=Meganyctiphanes norvegica TaxID=48144 RepID=A0AAV2QAQ8_MEGNR